MDNHKIAKSFVLDFFGNIGRIPGDTEAQHLDYDYVQDQMLDSFGLITLIVEAESKLKISFSSEDLENPEFKKIGGLIRIIESKLG